jgi:hypothetical protein
VALGITIYAPLLKPLSRLLRGAIPSPLRKKIRLRRKLEAFARACDYNLKRLCYLKHLEGIKVIETWNA